MPEKDRLAILSLRQNARKKIIVPISAVNSKTFVI
jgi:hypothetical protein